MTTKGFMKLRDFVQVDVLDVDPTKKRLFECKDNHSSTGYSLDILADVTFAGVLTANRAMYLPKEIAAAKDSFFSPYPKPVQLHHADHRDPIGRVKNTRYLDTSGDVLRARDSRLRDFSHDRFNLFTMRDKRTAFMELAMLSQDDTYTGLGRLRAHLNITDSAAVEKVLDGRFLTLSSGFRTKEAWCSTCLVNDEATDWVAEGPCDHDLGNKYDGVPMFLIPKGFSYDEVSFVNNPALPMSQVVSLHTSGFEDSADHTFELEVKDSGPIKVFFDAFVRKQDGNDLDSVISMREGQDTNILDHRNLLHDLSMLDHRGDQTEEYTLAEGASVLTPTADSLLKLGDALSVKSLADKMMIVRAHDELHHSWDWDLQYAEENSGPKGPSKDKVDLHQRLHKVAEEGDFNDALLLGALDEALTEAFPPGFKKDQREKDMYSLKDVTKDTASNYQLMCEHLAEDKRLSDEDLGKLEDSVFLGPERNFPVPDMAHVEAAKKVLDELEDGAGVKGLLLDYLSKREVKFTESEQETDIQDNTDVIDETKVEDDTAEALAAELQTLKDQLVDKDAMISILKKRADALESELDKANDAHVDLTTEAHLLLAEKVVDRKLALGHEIDDRAKAISEHKGRTWDSLKDSLQDLGTEKRADGLSQETDPNAEVDDPTKTTDANDLTGYQMIIDQYNATKKWNGKAAADMWLNGLKQRGLFPRDAELN